DRNRSHWSTSKTPSYTKSVSWQHHRAAQWNHARWLLNKDQIKLSRYYSYVNKPSTEAKVTSFS
ncbi:hypothetical protein, partial [Enterobacter asburiae]|uniref:hypothetical protein n=1 Tax=Enterobacter asburiae TaxID=61645 RepID=UPI0020765EC8